MPKTPIRISKEALLQMVEEMNSTGLNFVELSRNNTFDEPCPSIMRLRMLENKASAQGHYMDMKKFIVTRDSNNRGEFNIIDKS